MNATSAKSGMTVLMKKKRMNNKATIYTRIPYDILVRAGLLAAVQHVPRNKVLEDAIVEAIGCRYEATLRKKIIRQIKADIINSPYRKERVLSNWEKYLREKGIPAEDCETMLNKAANETNHTSQTTDS